MNLIVAIVALSIVAGSMSECAESDKEFRREPIEEVLTAYPYIHRYIDYLERRGELDMSKKGSVELSLGPESGTFYSGKLTILEACALECIPVPQYLYELSTLKTIFKIIHPCHRLYRNIEDEYYSVVRKGL